MRTSRNFKLFFLFVVVVVLGAIGVIFFSDTLKRTASNSTDTFTPTSTDIAGTSVPDINPECLVPINDTELADLMSEKTPLFLTKGTSIGLQPVFDNSGNPIGTQEENAPLLVAIQELSKRANVDPRILLALAEVDTGTLRNPPNNEVYFNFLPMQDRTWYPRDQFIEVAYLYNKKKAAYETGESSIDSLLSVELRSNPVFQRDVQDISDTLALIELMKEMNPDENLGLSMKKFEVVFTDVFGLDAGYCFKKI